MPIRDPEARKAYNLEYIKRRRLEWIGKNGPCRECGSWESPEVDHIDQSTKVSHKVWTWTKKRREEELVKCQVLCEKCHLKKTIVQNIARFPPPKHGLSSTYDKHGCRCDPCKEAKSVKLQRYRVRKKVRLSSLLSSV